MAEYRLLKPDETLVKGDEFAYVSDSPMQWDIVCGLAGRTVGAASNCIDFVARRRVDAEPEPAPWKPTPGECARTRDGRKAKVEFRVPLPSGPYRTLGGWIEGECDAWAWSEEGKYLDSIPSGKDLVGPWVEPPAPRVVEINLFVHPNDAGRLSWTTCTAPAVLDAANGKPPLMGCTLRWREGDALPTVAEIVR